MLVCHGGKCLIGFARPFGPALVKLYGVTGKYRIVEYADLCIHGVVEPPSRTRGLRHASGGYQEPPPRNYAVTMTADPRRLRRKMGHGDASDSSCCPHAPMPPW
jgi:hypothetical protein